MESHETRISFRFAGNTYFCPGLQYILYVENSLFLFLFVWCGGVDNRMEKYFLQCRHKDVGHELIAIVIGMEGCVYRELGEVLLVATEAEEVSYGQALIGCYFADEVSIVVEIDTIERRLAVGWQIGAEAVALTRGAEHYHCLGVGLVDGIDEATVVGCEGTVLGIVLIVVNSAHRGGVTPVVDAVLYGIIVGMAYLTDSALQYSSVDSLVSEALEGQHLANAGLVALRIRCHCTR